MILVYIFVNAFCRLSLQVCRGDLHGFEKLADGFESRHCTRTVQLNKVRPGESHSETSDACQLAESEGVAQVPRTKAVTETESEDIARSVTGNDLPKLSYPVCLEVQEPIKKNSLSSPHNVQNGSGAENRLARKLLEKAKSPKKFVLPTKSAHSCRPIIPNKRFLEEVSDVCRKKPSEERELQSKPHLRADLFRKLQSAASDVGLNNQGNFHHLPLYY